MSFVLLLVGESSGRWPNYDDMYRLMTEVVLNCIFSWSCRSVYCSVWDIVMYRNICWLIELNYIHVTSILTCLTPTVVRKSILVHCTNIYMRLIINNIVNRLTRHKPTPHAVSSEYILCARETWDGCLFCDNTIHHWTITDLKSRAERRRVRRYRSLHTSPVPTS